MRIAGIVVIATMALASCASREVDREPIGGSWIAEISGVGSEGIRGFVTASILREGGTRVNATLSEGSLDARHPWHVHAGTCGSGGPVVGEAASYPLLEPNARGNASASATLEVELAVGEGYHVNVHASPEDLGTIVGCGDLVPTG